MDVETTATRATAAQLLRERAYTQIRRMVMLGEFPTGQRLAEEPIAEQLAVSRTPVREAFVRLHADRLLKRFNDGGYYVAEIDLFDMRDLYELRLTLELRGLTRALEEGISHDRDALVELREAWLAIQADPPEPDGSFIELDESFHLALLRSSGNLALAETLESVNGRIRAVRTYDFLTEDRITSSIAEHLGIVEALLDDDIALSVDRLRDHIGASLEVVEQRAAEAIRQRSLRSRRNRGA
ncbi:GntR family transcriptional regulator [Nocardioides immobilis]|uniref:GntR family transcriptional regulator n=1 Tax=Nocardioides immobilis TaxID=2049295 RepID=A0A417Y307_9ACTN|nr:GntR family transcriptional regulator [Nocardioides immobilis]RHW27042.1 GntR family transcriptional regulator [Nocardioides immobilis]